MKFIESDNLPLAMDLILQQLKLMDLFILQDKVPVTLDGTMIEKGY